MSINESSLKLQKYVIVFLYPITRYIPLLVQDKTAPSN